MRFISAVLGGVIGAGIALFTVNKINAKESEKAGELEALDVSALIAAGEYDDEGEREPRFNVGDPVIITNPYVEVITSDDPPRHAHITTVAYDEINDVYAYQVTGATSWYNENWLSYDIYGTETYEIIEMVDMEAEEKSERKTNIDYWLTSLKYEKSRGNEAEAQRCVEELQRLSAGGE